MGPNFVLTTSEYFLNVSSYVIQVVAVVFSTVEAAMCLFWSGQQLRIDVCGAYELTCLRHCSLYSYGAIRKLSHALLFLTMLYTDK